MFREFHEFVLIAAKFGRYLSFDTINIYYAAGESRNTLDQMMPELINSTMTKIIENAPYEENDQEESKQSDTAAASPEEVKVKFPEEKPWKKKKPTKVYDLCRYTQE